MKALPSLGITTLLAACIALALALPASAACYDFPCYGPTDAVAHKGDVQYYTENSAYAIKSAIEKNADWVEIDVHWNEPSQRVILFHDNSCGGYNVETTPVSTLEQCTGQPIVYLDELLSYWTPRGFNRWLIELKAACAYYEGTGCDAGSYYANRLTYAVYLNLNQHSLHEKVWVQSFDHYMLQDLRAHRYGSRYPRLMKIRPHGVPGVNVSSGYLDSVKREGYQAVNVDIRATSENSVHYAHSIGLLFSTWAIGSYEEENEKAVYIDADFHVTDRLDHMIAITSGSTGGGGDNEEQECDRFSRTCG